MDEEVVVDVLPQAFSTEAQDALNSLQHKKRYTLAIDDIHPIEKSKTEPDFCHYIRAQVAIRQGKIKLALEHLAQITPKETELLANLHTMAQGMITDHVKAQAEKASALVKERQYRQALRAIEAIEASKTESNFCHFVRASIAKAQRSPKLVLKHLAQITDARTALQAELFESAQEMLVQLVKDHDQRALAFLDGASNREALVVITALENAEVDLNFCRFVKAKIAHKLNDSTNALKFLSEITEVPSEFIPTLSALTEEMRSSLIQQQATLALNALNKANYIDARNAISSLVKNKLEPGFCNYVEAQIAYDNNDPTIAVTRLIKIFAGNEINADSVITFNVEAAAETLRDKIVREHTQRALELVETTEYATAIIPIEIIEPTHSEPNICHYIRARVAQKNNEPEKALQHLARITLPLSSDKKMVGEFDLDDAVQQLLVPLIVGQLKKLSRENLPLPNESHFSNIDLQNSSLNIIQSLAPFVSITRQEGLGIRFDFTDKLSLENQLHVLENFKIAEKEFFENNYDEVRIFGETMDRNQYLYYLTREQYFIQGLIYQQQERWSTAYAYFTKAFLVDVYKKEFSALRFFYFTGVSNFTPNPSYSYEQLYKVLQSMRVNELITDDEYVRWLSNLQTEVAEFILLGHDSSLCEDNSTQVSSESRSSSIEKETTPESDDTPPLDSATSPEPPSKEVKAKLLKLVDKIERQILLYDTTIKSEKIVSDFVEKNSFAQPKIQKTQEQLQGENIAKDYFKSVWNFCWQLKAMKVAAFFFVLPQILTLVAATLAAPVILARKKYQLVNKHKRSADEITEDDKKLEGRRVELKDNAFKRARLKDTVANSKHHLMLAPPPEIEEMQPVSDDRQQLEETRISHAKTMRISVPGQ